MKLLSLVVLSSFLLSLAVVGAQQTGLPIYSWMDTTATSALTWTLPSVSDPNFVGQACALSTRSNEQNVKYIAYSFSVNFTGVYEIIGQSGLGVQSNQGGDNFDLDVYLYNGTFDATNPCSNYVRELAQQNYPTAGFSGSPRVEDFAYLRQGATYTLVATGVDNTSQGRFGLSLYAPIATGNNVGGPRWNSLVWYGKNQNPACTPNTANAPFITYRWLQPTTGFYDVVIGFDINYTIPVSVAAALYLGNVTTATLQSSNPCNIVSGGTLMDGISSGNFQGTTMYYNRLMQNAVYTLVVSGASATQLGNYGVQIMPSRMFNLSTTVNYQSPGRPNGLITATSTCPSSGSELLNWVAIPFSAQADISVVTVPPDWNSPNFDSFDSYTYIFSGTNTANPPTQCTGLVGGWDDRVPAINTTAGPYTVVITPYDDGSFVPASNELTLVYIASGATTPVVPIATTSTGSTTAAPTTTTTTTTTGSATTTTGSASTTSSTANVTTTTTSTTSMASATTVSLVLIFVVSFLCVF